MWTCSTINKILGMLSPHQLRPPVALFVNYESNMYGGGDFHTTHLCLVLPAMLLAPAHVDVIYCTFTAVERYVSCTLLTH